MKTLLSIVFASVLLAACQHHSGSHYSATSVNAAGRVLNTKTQIASNEAGIDLAVKTLCKANRNARYVVVKNRSDQQVDGSPFRCR